MAELVKESVPKTKPKAPQRKRKSKSLEKIKSRSGWLFILPLLIGLIFIYVPILVNSINFSFSSIRHVAAEGVNEVTNVGFRNYVTALGSTEDGNLGFIENHLVSGLRQLAFTIPPVVVFSLFIAVLLNQKMMGRAAFRAIYFVPVIIATGLMDTLAQGNIMVGVAYGDGGSAMAEPTAASAIVGWQVEALFQIMAIGDFMTDFVIEIMGAIFDIINRSGVQILIFLAGLQAIPAEVYESCRMDGATSWETFWKITFPMISPMILVNTVYSIIDFFTASNNTIMGEISRTFYAEGATIATAMGWFYLLVIGLIIMLVMGVMSAFVFYQRRD
ncbi:MAG: sugar ABC transporter permease [Oscillospiraceae bacterium]|nr:sugar ABC transporter permease [Oscillospiraceae bacterium]